MFLSAFFFTLPAAGARFSLVHDSLDGGGGTTFAGRYTSDSTLSPITGAGHVYLLNSPPSPGRDSFELPLTGPLTISVPDLLANDFDLEGNNPSLSLLQTNTTHGGTINLSNGIITYTPPANPNPRGDSFAYLVADGLGAATVGTAVLFSRAAAPRLVELEASGNGLRVRFQALPDAAYMLQVRSNFLAQSWWFDFPDINQPTIQRADTNGTFEFIIPPGTGNAFFRAVDVEGLQAELIMGRTGSRFSAVRRGLPNTLYKLQFRDRFSPENAWRDHPGARQPFTVRTATDGLYSLNTPLGGPYGFFRMIPLDQ